MSSTKPILLETSSADILVSNLQHLIDSQKISEAELCRRTGIPQPTLYKILSGKTADPRISTLQVLANYFEVSLDALYSLDLQQHSANTLPKARSIPILSWTDCVDQNPTKNLSPNNWNDWMVIDMQSSECVYGLKSKPAMSPRFPRGTIFVIDAKADPIDGDLVIAHYPDTKEATLRELSMDGPTKLLLSINDSAKPDTLTNRIKIIGVVIQSRFSYQDEK